MNNTGRPPKYTPKEIAEGFTKYQKETKATPKQVSVISRGEVVTMPKERPLTIVGFCGAMGIAKSTFYDYAKRDEFLDIYTHVREAIEADQTEGAMLEIYTPSITARLLGLAEKKDITSDGAPIQAAQPTVLHVVYGTEEFEFTADDIEGRDDE